MVTANPLLGVGLHSYGFTGGIHQALWAYYGIQWGICGLGAVAWFLDTAEPRQYMRNAVYLNTGTERFMEVAHLTGLASSKRKTLGSSPPPEPPVPLGPGSGASVKVLPV